jgi:hypothetical protein
VSASAITQWAAVSTAAGRRSCRELDHRDGHRRARRQPAQRRFEALVGEDRPMDAAQLLEARRELLTEAAARPARPGVEAGADEAPADQGPNAAQTSRVSTSTVDLDDLDGVGLLRR